MPEKRPCDAFTFLPWRLMCISVQARQLLHEYRQTGVASETNKFMVQILSLGERDLLPVADVPDKMLAKVREETSLGGEDTRGVAAGVLESGRVLIPHHPPSENDAWL